MKINKDEVRQMALIEKLESDTTSLPEVIKTEDDAFVAVDSILKVRKLWNEIEEKRKERTAPANETIRLINEDFKKFLAPLKEMEVGLKKAIEYFADDVSERDMKRLEELRKNTKDKELAIPIGLSSLPSPSGEVRFRKGYGITISDIKKVPKQFWKIDEAAILAEVEKAEGNVKIPGVEVNLRNTVAIYVK